MSEPLRELKGYDELEEQSDLRFHITNDQEAEWAMEQIRNAQEEKDKWKAFYDSRYQAVCATCDLTIANMESLLQSYFESVPHKVTKTQENYALPSGKLVFKKQDPEYKRTDSEVIDWLKKNGGERFIVTKETLDWAALKKTINVVGDAVADEDGQIMPITVVARPDVFKVELKKGEEA